jgi:S-adenosylmethionine hydrolase
MNKSKGDLIFVKCHPPSLIISKLVFFNSEKVLQIGINMGRASELLGIRMDASVYINFNIQ